MMDPNSFGNCKASRTLVSLIEGDRRMRRFVSDLWTQFNREIANNFYWSKERHHAELVEVQSDVRTKHGLQHFRTQINIFRTNQ